ncbi:MAG: hypothetical protein JO240_04645 [Solirubrobacterales bacterium]|nr:hypothetical protein [Solirubrobacterales bacterium]
MGLLDDAIREHLDLKRRRGADPAEIERAEREALGPVRRYPEATDTPVDHEPVEDGPLAYDHYGEDWPEDELPEDFDETRASGADTVEAASPPPSGAASPPEPAHRVGQETEEYDITTEHEHKTADEDVLEETPEFLQDTPDHDRLWFEQRPPRDFDFEG